MSGEDQAEEPANPHNETEEDDAAYPDDIDEILAEMDVDLDSDETQNFGTAIPADLAEQANEKLGYGDRKDILTNVAARIAYGAWNDRDPYHVAIRYNREKMHSLQTEIDDLQTELDRKQRHYEELQQETERLEQAADELPTPEERYVERLEVLERQLRKHGRHFGPRDEPIVTLAEQYDKDPTEVHDELKRRNPDIPDEAFTEYDHTQYDGSSNEREWYGYQDDEEMVTLSVDERERQDDPTE